MSRLVAYVATLTLAISSAFGQTQPTQPILPRTSTPRIQPLNPNSPCYASEIGPCSSAGQPSGISIPTAPNTQPPLGFTVSQAMARMQAAGYTRVTGLQQDARGNWNARATKDGKTVQVTLDFNGNVKDDTGSVSGGGGPTSYQHAFTADQARSQIEAGGYSAVTQLKKDTRGNWHGRAFKDGSSVDVTLNFNGTIDTK